MVYPTLALQELIVVLAAKNHNPTLLNPDFLRYSGIVPLEWELARPPVLTQRSSQVTFQNGIAVIAEPDRVVFVENIQGKAIAEIAIPRLAQKYMESLPNIDYQGIGLNPRGYAAFPGGEDAAQQYLTGTLLAPGSWFNFGEAPARSAVSFVYTLEHGLLSLSVSEALLQESETQAIPIVLFVGNFNYTLTGESHNERLQSLSDSLGRWQVDLEVYQNLVNQKFLAKAAEKPALLKVFAS